MPFYTQLLSKLTGEGEGGIFTCLDLEDLDTNLHWLVISLGSQIPL